MSETLPRHARELLNRYKQLQVLTLASIQVARNRIEELSEVVEETDDEAVPIVNINRRTQRLNRWLSRAQKLLSWLDRKSHEIGVIVQKVQMEVIDPSGEQIRRLTQLMSDKHTQAAVDALEHLGRGNYNEALTHGEQLLVDESDDEDVEKLETTDEFEELLTEMATDDDVGVSVDDDNQESTTLDDPTVEMN